MRPGRWATSRLGEAAAQPPGRAVKYLLCATLAVFVLQTLVDEATRGWFTYWFGLRREGVLSGLLWQPITYLLLHGGLWHLFMNLLMLYMFGSDVEEALGEGRFVKLYLACGLAGGLGWIAISGMTGVPCIGASGAVFGVLGAFAALFPDRPVMLLLIPVAISARVMALLLGVVSLVSMVRGPGGIAHAAHLAGGLAGYLYGRRVAAAGVPGRARFNRFPRRAARTRPAPPPPDPEEVDRILEKITVHGLRSLTTHERRELERASVEQ